MKKAIFFDAGYTLINVYGCRKTELLRRLCEPYVMQKLTDQQWWKGALKAEIYYQLASFRPKYVKTKQYLFNYYRIGLTAAGLSPDQAKQTANRIVLHGKKPPKTYQLIEDAIPTLAHLKQSGYRLAVISNWNGTLERVFAELGIAHYFDLLVDSHVVGVRKPRPEIFQYALGKLRLEPNEAIHIGDSYYADVLGAKKAGMDAILYDPFGSLGKRFRCKSIVRLKQLIE